MRTGVGCLPGVHGRWFREFPGAARRVPDAYGPGAWVWRVAVRVALIRHDITPRLCMCAGYDRHDGQQRAAQWSAWVREHAWGAVCGLVDAFTVHGSTCLPFAPHTSVCALVRLCLARHAARPVSKRAGSERVIIRRSSRLVRPVRRIPHVHDIRRVNVMQNNRKQHGAPTRTDKHNSFALLLKNNNCPTIYTPFN